MKKLGVLLVVLFVTLASFAYAGPYLVCAPYPASDPQPTEFVMFLDGREVVEPAYKNPDGTVQLFYDLEAISTGPHTLTVAARNEWGDSAAVPFPFTKSLPGPPGGVSISRELPR